jgi:hypothetical protein
MHSSNRFSGRDTSPNVKRVATRCTTAAASMKVCKTAARILQEEQQGKEATTNVEKTDGNRPLK